MPVLAESFPVSRSLPAGKAMPAWKTAQILAIQKASVRVQPWACSRVDSAEL